MSEIVLGETLLSVSNDVRDGQLMPTKAAEVSRRLTEAAGRDLIRLCGLGAHDGGDPIGIAHQLRREDDKLTVTDALVVAAALSCEDCEVLFTNDRQILTSRSIINRSREKPLTIREAP